MTPVFMDYMLLLLFCCYCCYYAEVSHKDMSYIERVPTAALST